MTCKNCGSLMKYKHYSLCFGTYEMDVWECVKCLNVMEGSVAAEELERSEQECIPTTALA